MPGEGIGDDEVELGRVSGVFGVAGEVRLHLHHRDSQLLRVPRQVFLVGEDGRRMSARLKSRPGAGRRVIGRIDGVTDRDAARSWQGWRIAIPKDALPPPEDDEFYVWEVEGLPVYAGDERVGEVVTLHATDGADVFEVQIGKERVFVPAVGEYVHEVDIEGGRVVIDPAALE